MNDIVKYENNAPALTGNPFAKEGIDYSGLAVGNTAIESERAIAEAQGKMLLAKRFPRDQARAYARIMEACRRKSFAETAAYAFPRGGKMVIGPTIRLAEMMASAYGNLEYGLRELSQNAGTSEMEAYCWDLETNVISSQRFTVQHKSLAKDAKDLTQSRDIYERTANDGARRLRSRIFAILPPDLIEAAEMECKKTLAGQSQEPLIDGIRRMTSEFDKLGINATMIAEHLGHPIDQMLPEELSDLRQIFRSIRDGQSKAGEWFAPKGSGTAAAMTEALKKPAPQTSSGSEPLTTATAIPKPVEAAVAKRKPKENAAQSATTPPPMVAKTPEIDEDTEEMDV
jgi:hypothetical protein